MKKIAYMFVGMYVIFWLVSCTKWTDTPSRLTDLTSTGSQVTETLPQWVMLPQERAEIQGLSKKLQDIDANIAAVHSSQIPGGWAAVKSLLDQKQEILKEFQNKVVVVRKDQELLFKEHINTQKAMITEWAEMQSKLNSEHKEKMNQVDASIRSLLKEREGLIKQKINMMRLDTPESKRMAEIEVELKKLQDQKSAISDEFQVKNSKMQSDWQAKMSELQKVKEEKNQVLNDRIKIIQLSQNPPTK